MRPFVLVQTAWAGIKALFVLLPVGHVARSRNADMALKVQRPPLEGAQPNEEDVRGRGCGRSQVVAIVLRLQKSRKAQQPVKAVVGQMFGHLSGFSNNEKPKRLELLKWSKTKSTGAAI